MPDEMILMADVDTHTPVYMHSVDAAEAARSGDYVYVPPGEEPEPAVKAAAMAAAKGMNPVVHPELQSPEQRERNRREANEYAAATAEAQGVPVPPSVRHALDNPRPARASTPPAPEASPPVVQSETHAATRPGSRPGGRPPGEGSA